ncbi:MAG TPA: 2-oxoglutarate dehydrogenase E1 component, partial [Beijerinckiaceae bacterium]|nr:2-oxoglutarate dehydrogenase E1 component [Beijerinckiaceae bacterium]
MDRDLDLSALSGSNAAYLEALTGDVTPGPSWKRSNWPVVARTELTSALDSDWSSVEKAVADKLKGKAAAGGAAPSAAQLQAAARDSVHALMMIRAYRMRGHLHADLDPLGIEPRKDHEELHPSSYGFTEEDWDRKIFIDHVLGLEFATIREMLAILRRTYCATIGYEFMHISDPAQKAWLQARIEGPEKEITFTREGKRAILNKLVEAEGFEKFLDRKFTGTKRFGLDGGEALIPGLEQIIKRGGNLGVKEIVFGMAHRGRLNVLTQVMAKPHRALFHEFKGGSFAPDEVEGSGDVKYHLGASSDREFDGNKVHLSLTPNPSHLEIVNPVVLGRVRAKQDQLNCTPEDRRAVLPLLIHGDAAFAGQGVVAECFGMSGLKGHRTGGWVSVIINNQIGFTTYPRFSRSSPYPSDMAKIVEAPIFHVNGDDPEAVVFVCKVAAEFRQKFQKPVVVDMWCYRRFGHNEGDEPAFTQPLMYQKIRSHRTTLEIYAEKLIAEKVVTQGEVDKMKADWVSRLEAEFEAGHAYKPNKADWLEGAWEGLKAGTDAHDDPLHGKTGVAIDTLRSIGRKIATIPEGFNAHRTIQRFMDGRLKMVESGEGLDWAMAEALAYGTLVDEGYPVRLSGQDCERGTFSQRHSVIIDQVNENRHTPLNNLRAGQKRYEVINSMLSEEAVLGFEYGYSLVEPNTLTLWEGQFGDFANGAQVVFDQFISSGERKWLRLSGLVCLLPHGFEGQGPEHSSARLERFLQLCAEDNMQVANCTTPANYFHILRRQMKRDIRKPLILMTPKSLLRHPRCKSSLADLGADSSFHRFLRDDADGGNAGYSLAKDAKIRRVIICTGKVYFDLLEEREKRNLDDVYLLRVEQLYPFPLKALTKVMQRFRKADVVWCQEEPKNMGGWSFVEPYLEWVL